MAHNRTRTIDSVRIACNIVQTLQEMNGAGVTELSKELGHSKSTIHSHLATLNDEQLIVKTNGTYRLSLRLLDIAEHVKESIGNYDIIVDELEKLAEETGEVAQFGILEHEHVRYLHKAKGQNGVDTASSIGNQQPLHSTGLGRAIMAYLPRARVDEIIADVGLPAKTAATITSREELYAELERTRERGYAVDDEENIHGLRCIAAPVRDGEDIFGALSISGPSSRFRGERLAEELPMMAQRAANVIELNTKFS